MGYSMNNYDLDDLSSCGHGGYWGQFDCSYIADMHGCVRDDDYEYSVDKPDKDDDDEEDEELEVMYQQDELTEDQMENITVIEFKEWERRKALRERKRA